MIDRASFGAGDLVMARRVHMPKELPKSYLPLIALVIIAWAELEAEIDAFVGLEQRDHDSPISGKPLEISYRKRLKLLKEALKHRLPHSLDAVSTLLGTIQPLKESRDLIAHGSHWFIPARSKTPRVKSWRWFTNHTVIQFSDFSRATLIKLENDIKAKGRELRKLLRPELAVPFVSYSIGRGEGTGLEHLRPDRPEPTRRRRRGPQPK
jgi:hypothetical protein